MNKLNAHCTIILCFGAGYKIFSFFPENLCIRKTCSKKLLNFLIRFLFVKTIHVFYDNIIC